MQTTERKFLVAKPLSDELAGKVLYNDGFENAMKQFQALVAINPGDVEQVTVPDIMVVQGRTQHVQAMRTTGGGPRESPWSVCCLPMAAASCRAAVSLLSSILNREATSRS